MAKAKQTDDLTTDTERDAPPPAQKPGDEVWVTITKFGDGQVSTGQHIAGEGDEYAKRGDRMLVSSRVADSLEARGLAERD